MPDDTRSITPTLPSYDAMMRAGCACEHMAKTADRAHLFNACGIASEAAHWRCESLASFAEAAAHLGFALVPIAAVTKETTP